MNGFRAHDAGEVEDVAGERLPPGRVWRQASADRALPGRRSSSRSTTTGTRRGAGAFAFG